MMLTSNRKRKLHSDSDSQPAKKTAGEAMSPVKRSSPRKRSLGSRTARSPQRSPQKPAGSPAKSPRRSPRKPCVVTSSFYGSRKPSYLTPLERRAIKESLPQPPPPPSSSPPSKEKKQVKKNVRGGNKQKKAAVGSKKAVKTVVQTFSASSKKIKLPKLKSTASSLAAKAAPPAAAAPVSSSKPAEPKKPASITLGLVKPKPKIFVGAAFFGTGKKPASMYKKAAPKSSRPKIKTSLILPASAPPPPSAPTKQQTPPSAPTKQQTPPSAPSAPTVTQPAQAAVQQPVAEDARPAARHRATFDPTEWMDVVEDQPETPESSSSLHQRYGITKELLVVLTRTPTGSPTSTAVSPSPSPSPSLSSQDDAGSDPDFSPTGPRKGPSAVYPIFGSASKKQKKCLQPPGSSSASSGPALPLHAAPAAKERSVRRRKEKQDEDQLIIDAGQKQFGATICSSCGMVYSADNPEDNFQHTQFHQRFLDSIKYVGWKKERVVAEFWDGKILLVMPDDPKYATKKAEDVRRIADSELGFQQVALSRPALAKTYLFINTERMVVGCLVAEPIRQAFRVLEQPDRPKDMTRDDFMDQHRAWCCSTVPEPALCGVSRIWVFSLARRKSIATRLLDALRSSFVYGSHLTREEIAFSDPTPDGKLFATKYCSTPAFLVYNFVA